MGVKTIEKPLSERPNGGRGRLIGVYLKYFTDNNFGLYWQQSFIFCYKHTNASRLHMTQQTKYVK